MDSEWKHTIEDFIRIWPRVRPPLPPDPFPPPPPPPPRPPRPGGQRPWPARSEAADLQSLAKQEAEAASRCAAMANMTGNRVAGVLRNLAAQHRAMQRRLETEYHLRTGAYLPMPRRGKPAPSLSQGLRAAWISAGELEKAYAAAAKRTDDPELREIYAQGEALAKRERRETRELAERLQR